MWKQLHKQILLILIENQITQSWFFIIPQILVFSSKKKVREIHEN